jgi:hypothetical protein
VRKWPPLCTLPVEAPLQLKPFSFTMNPGMYMYDPVIINWVVPVKYEREDKRCEGVARVNGSSLVQNRNDGGSACA